MDDKKQNRPKIGVALSGGAARGFAHIGALKVLHEAEVPIDFLMGTSVGSVIGAAYASGTSFDEMLEICSSMRWRDIAKLTFSKRGLASIDRSNPLLDRLIHARTFEELRFPFYAVATDIQTGETIVLSRGDLKTALRASCAVPGLFIPVEIQGRSLVDGGVSANLPVLPLRQLGAEKIIAIDTTSRIDQARPPRNVFEIILQSMFIIGRAALRTAREQAHLVVEPQVHSYDWDDFGHCAEIVKAGEQAMRSSLHPIQAWLPSKKKKSLWERFRSAFD